MLVSSGTLPRDSERWSIEAKRDGLSGAGRGVVRRAHDLERNGNDMSARYPELQGFRENTNISGLDGEIVCFDSGGPDFLAVWNRSRGQTSPPVCFMAFDALQVGDELLVDRPYVSDAGSWKTSSSGPHRCTPPSNVGEGAALFVATKEMGLEGVVAKRPDSRYRPGLRTRSWVKTKHL